MAPTYASQRGAALATLRAANAAYEAARDAGLRYPDLGYCAALQAYYKAKHDLVGLRVAAYAGRAV